MCTQHFFIGGGGRPPGGLCRAKHAGRYPVAYRFQPRRQPHRAYFCGHGGGGFQAARACLKTTLELADMRLHRGAHPRLGALDVCPFVPVSGITLQEAARLAVRFGQLAAQEFNVPVYLYEAAARRAQTRNLADVRRGEYESLPQKCKRSRRILAPACLIPALPKPAPV